MAGIFRVRHALLIAALLWPFAAFAAAPQAAREVAAAPGDRRQAEDTKTPAEPVDQAAAGQTCERLFDARGDAFDAATTVASCRRAAESGDAAALLRLGLFSLAGVGMPKDLGAAARQCSEAQ